MPAKFSANGASPVFGSLPLLLPTAVPRFVALLPPSCDSALPLFSVSAFCCGVGSMTGFLSSPVFGGVFGCVLLGCVPVGIPVATLFGVTVPRRPLLLRLPPPPPPPSCEAS